jgi:T5SS/PEP-CTERM-associated repeat protein
MPTSLHPCPRATLRATAQARPTRRATRSQSAPKRLTLALAVAAALVAAAPVGAATRTWTGVMCGAATGNGSDACNWSAGDGDWNNWDLAQANNIFTLPESGDSLVFDGVFGLRARQDIVALTSVSGISFLQGAGPFVFIGRTLTTTGNITNASSQLQTLSLGLNVGSSQTWDGGSGGMLVNGTVALGTAPLSLVNHTRLANATLPFTINSTLNLASGSSFFSASAALGTVTGKNASVTVTGAGSSWVNTGAVELGPAAASLVQVLDGATVSSGKLTLTDTTDRPSFQQVVRINGAGSIWAASDLSLSGSGSVLRVEDGGHLSTVNTVMGVSRPGYPKLTVTGVGSSWVNSGQLAIGGNARASVEVLAGGSVVSAQATLGGRYAFGSTVTVDGSGSTWTTTGAILFGAADPSTGTMTVRAGGQANFGSATVGDAYGKLTVSGAGSQVRNTADFKISQGMLQVDGGGSFQTLAGALLVGVAAIDSGTVTVTGTGSTLRSALTIVGQLGSGVLNVLDGGTADTGALQVGALGVVNLNGGTLRVDSVANGGSFNWTAGTLRFNGDLNLRTEPLLGSITTLTTGRTLQAHTLTVDSDSILKLAGGNAQANTLLLTGLAVVGRSSTLTLTGGSPLAVPSELLPLEAALDNRGLVQLSGGTLSAVGAIVNSEVLSGWGTVAGNGGLTNLGLIAVAGGDLSLSNTGYIHNIGSWAMLAGRSLALSGGLFYNEGAMSLAGGTISGTGNARLVNRRLATLTGHGVISAPFTNAGRLVVDSGTLNITNAFTNSGEVLLSTAAATLSGGLVTNLGRVAGLGQVNNTITNLGTVSAQGAGATLTLAGGVNNLGTLEAGPGATLRLPGGLGENHGVIHLAGGSFDGSVAGGINATSGVISGFGSLRVGTLLNEGHMLLGGGVSELHTDLTNGAGDFETPAGQIVLSGDTTFHGTARFETGSELRVSGGAVATFLGAVQQRTGALFTGSGSKHFDGGFSVGASPGVGVDGGDVAFGAGNTYLAEIGGTSACTLACGSDDALKDSSFDKYIVSGQLSLGGTLKLVSWNGFVAQAGQHFDLLDWGSQNGSFSHIDSSGLLLAAGTALDFSQIYTLGTVSVTAVPEPGTLTLWLAGLGLAAGASARRRAARAMAEAAA